MLGGRRADRAVALREVRYGRRVAEREDALELRHPHLRRDRHPPAHRLGVQRADQRTGGHPGRPDQRPAGEHPAVGELDGLGPDLGHRDAERHLDAALAQHLEGGLAERVAEFGHQLRRDVDQVPLDLPGVQTGVAPGRGGGQPLEAGRRLGARVAAADHHELQPRLAFALVQAGRGQVELGDHVVAYVGGLGERLHAARVVGQAGDVEGAGDTPGREHQVVVAFGDHLVGDLPHHADLGARVHADRPARDDVRAPQGPPQRDGHRLRSQHTGRDVRQQRQVQLVAERCDQGDLRLRGRELAFQAAGALQSGEAAAHDQDPRTFHRSSLQCWSEPYQDNCSPHSHGPTRPATAERLRRAELTDR